MCARILQKVTSIKESVGPRQEIDVGFCSHPFPSHLQILSQIVLLFLPVLVLRLRIGLDLLPLLSSLTLQLLALGYVSRIIILCLLLAVVALLVFVASILVLLSVLAVIGVSSI